MPNPIPDNAGLNAMSLSAMLDLYNEHAESKGQKKVQSFRDKPTAWARLAALRDGTKPEPRPRKTSGSRKAAKAAKTKRPGRRAANWDLAAAKTIRAPRPGTMRERIARMLSNENGATVEQVNAQVGEGKWTRRHTREHILLLHTSCGYGLKQDPETGRIRLVGEATVPATGAKATA